MSKKITQLPAASDVATNDLVPIVDVSAGATKKATVAQIAALVPSATPGGSDGDVQVKNGTALAGKTLTAGDGVRVTSDSTHLYVHGVRGTCSLEQFGAVGDGVTSDQTAIAAAFAALAAGTYNTLVLGAKTYLGTWGMSVPAGCAIIGQGQSSVLKQTGAAAAVLLIGAVNDIVLRDFKILGDGTATSEAYGVKMGVSGIANSGPQRVALINIHAENCWSDGFVYYRSPKVDHQGPCFVRCVAKNCGNWGFRVAEEGEYAQFIGCQATGCTYGIYLAAGNSAINGGNFSNNTYGVYVAPGTNAGHGSVVGATINHNSQANVYIGAIDNGHTFVSCDMFASDIRSVSSTSLPDFTGCRVSPTAIVCTDGMMRFNDCEFDADYGITDLATTGGSGNGWVELVNPRGVDGNLPAYVRNAVRVPFTFAADANQTLTAQQSVAETLVIADGTITATRQLTSYFGPGAGRKIRIVNNNSHDVTFKWSSGTAVTIATGEWALIGGDNTNAEKLEHGDASGGGGGGEANTSSNVGGGIEWANAKSGVDLPFKTLDVEPPLVPSVSSDLVTITLGNLTSFGSPGDSIRVDGAGTSFEWYTPSAGPSGTDTRVAFFDSTSIGDDADFTWDKTNNLLTVTGGYRQGSAPATAGAGRFSNNTSLQWRNAANSGNLEALTVNNSDQCIIGNSGFAALIIKTDSGGTIYFRPTANDALTITGSAIKFNAAIGGDSAYSAPMKVRSTSVAIATGAVNPPDVGCPIVVLTGTTIVGSGFLELPNTADAVYWVSNQTSTTIGVRHVGSSSTTINVGAGKSGMYWHNGTDYLPLGCPNGGA